MIYVTRLSIAFALSALLAGCGGGGAWDPDDDDDGGNPSEMPGAPVGLTANAGDQAISLGWSAPAVTDGSSLSYEIALSPNVATAAYTVVGTTALVRGLRNDTTYTVEVTARNGAGASPAASIQAKPAAPAVLDYAAMAITGNPAGSGGFADPAPLRTASGQIWMAYSDTGTSLSGQILRSKVRLAQSSDNGASYRYMQEIGGQVATVGIVPAGDWYYRTPSLIEDSSDPDVTRRFKLFAHKYFYNPIDNTVNYELGAIVMWTATAPDGQWSEENIVLGWTGTHASLQPPARLNLLDTDLQACQWVDAGSASVGSDGIDMVFSCATDESLGLARKIVLLHSADHALTFSYVATLLQPIDALAYSAEFFSRPALLPGAGTAPVLFVSPILDDGSAQGCIVFPIGDPKTGKLFLDENNAPLALQTLPPVGTDSGGCGWDRNIPTGGILMGDRVGSDYGIHATNKPL